VLREGKLMKQTSDFKTDKADVVPQGDAATSPQIPQQAPSLDCIDRLRNRILQAALIVLAGLWVYSPSYHGEWLWDDDQMLTANPTVQHRMTLDPNVPTDSLATLKKLWFSPDGPDYFPLSYTALWAQWPFFGMESTGYHVTTILFHISGALLFWALLAKMKIPGAWLSGFLFAIHPVCVESVAWISETKNTVSLPFFMLSCIFWVAQDDEPAATKRQRFYVLSIIFFLISMLAKTSIVAFPVVTLLYAWWKRRKVTERDIVLSLPLFAISIVLGLVTISYQWGRAIGQEKIIIADLLTMDGFLSRTAIAGMGILHYLASIVWPVGLLPIYPRWEVDPLNHWMFLAWPILFAGIWWMWRKRNAAFPSDWGRHGLFVIGFFLLMLAPVLGFVTISYMRITWVADHFVYKPMISVVAFLGAGVVVFYNRLKESSKLTFLVIGSLLLAALAFLGFRQTIVWKDEDHLWEYTLKHNNNAWQAHNRLGARKASRGDIDGAHYHFLNATRLRPDLGETHNNLGSSFLARSQILEQQGDHSGAEREKAAGIHHFSEACRVTPQITVFHVNLANALTNAGRFAEAGEKYKEILSNNPNNPAMINNYGFALFNQGKKQEAIAQFRRALEIAPDLKDARESLAMALSDECKELLNKDPKNPTLINNYGVALLNQGMREAAIDQFRHALEIAPNLKDASDNLANAMADKNVSTASSPIPPPKGKSGELEYDKNIADTMAIAGRFIEAGEKYKELLKREPNNPTLINNYGTILFRQGKNDEAITQYRRALELSPDLKDASSNLAVALSQKPSPPANITQPKGDKKQPDQ
jgi:Tfp pilus assembly protein PilF